jgi:hypothetical protein
MSSKRQTTMAKFARERAVKEKRERKREKKAAAAAAKAAGLPFPEEAPAERNEADPSAPEEQVGQPPL